MLFLLIIYLSKPSVLPQPQVLYLKKWSWTVFCVRYCGQMILCVRISTIGCESKSVEAISIQQFQDRILAYVLLRSATSDSDTEPGYGMLILCYLVQRTKWEYLSLHIAYNLSKFHILWKKCQ